MQAHSRFYCLYASATTLWVQQALTRTSMNIRHSILALFVSFTNTSKRTHYTHAHNRMSRMSIHNALYVCMLYSPSGLSLLASHAIHVCGKMIRIVSFALTRRPYDRESERQGRDGVETHGAWGITTLDWLAKPIQLNKSWGIWLAYNKIVKVAYALSVESAFLCTMFGCMPCGNNTNPSPSTGWAEYEPRITQQ